MNLYTAKSVLSLKKKANLPTKNSGSTKKEQEKVRKAIIVGEQFIQLSFVAVSEEGTYASHVLQNLSNLKTQKKGVPSNIFNKIVVTLKAPPCSL